MGSGESSANTSCQGRPNSWRTTSMATLLSKLGTCAPQTEALLQAGHAWRSPAGWVLPQSTCWVLGAWKMQGRPARQQRRGWGRTLSHSFCISTMAAGESRSGRMDSAWPSLM